MSQLERRRRANAIRALAMDAVEAAKSGHPGMPMGMADIAEVLWCDFLRHNPANPAWPDRDRFVLSNGHGSMLQYALLHLSGYDLPLAEIKRFRQLDSLTPGHPEFHLTPGVETTTGPLGQGLANAVGMALAEKVLAARFNRPGFDVVDHYTYAFVGDGCLMEGISHEVASLAGTLALGKLIVFYDDNGISIDGPVAGWFTDDTPKRFEAYGWHVLRDVDGHNAEQIKVAIVSAQALRDMPTLICCKTTIGYGAPNKQGKESSHGAPLGAAEIAATREILGWHEPPFVVPDEIRQAFDARARGDADERAWHERLIGYRAAYPELASEFERRLAGLLPSDFDERADALIREIELAQHGHATRKSSQIALQALMAMVPELMGGSADLTHSNLTQHALSKTVNASNPDGNTLYFGVREFGMTAIANGIALHGGLLPFVATFLVFSDYARNAVRMSALIPAQTIHVYTHDSIGLGEDGPTHQPVEHLASLRLIPDLEVWRPADAVETTVAWIEAVKRKGRPSVLALTRQNLPHQFRADGALRAISRGGYILLAENPGELRLMLIATGSEVEIARRAAIALTEHLGAVVRVVSMPCLERFKAQPIEYREAVLPSWCRARVVVEAGSTALWAAIAGDQGRIIGLDRFGASAPGDVLMQHFGFDAAAIAAAGRELLGH